MMLGSKGLLPPSDTGLLRTLYSCSPQKHSKSALIGLLWSGTPFSNQPNPNQTRKIFSSVQVKRRWRSGVTLKLFDLCSRENWLTVGITICKTMYRFLTLTKAVLLQGSCAFRRGLVLYGRSIFLRLLRTEILS